MGRYNRGAGCYLERLNISVRDIQMNVKRYNSESDKKVVLLHGFTGSTNTWEEVVSSIDPSIEILTIDLIGHGETDKPKEARRYLVEEQVADLHELFQQIGWEHFTLVGYSMGGRLALAYSSKHGVDRLILESSSPGLNDQDARIERKFADEQLAQRIIEEGVPAFIDYWEQIPLFDSQKRLSHKKKKMIREERLSQTAVGLSNSLKGFSTGEQPSLWGNLNSLHIPVTLLTGELDVKFCEIAKKMLALLPNANWKIINNVGHAIHVENPKLFATIVEDIILKEDIR